jgi:hypothetical protein
VSVEPVPDVEVVDGVRSQVAQLDAVADRIVDRHHDLVTESRGRFDKNLGIIQKFTDKTSSGQL